MDVGPAMEAGITDHLWDVEGAIGVNREQFKTFVEETIENVIQFSEQYTGQQLPRPRKYCFRWLFNPDLVCDNVSEVITRTVYEDEAHIHPCVDIGVGNLLDDGTLIIEASIAGYAPEPFGKNWTGREGPFVYVVGQTFIEKIKAR